MEPVFDALVEIRYDLDMVFESFSTAIVNGGLSLACAIWRDTWTENDPLAAYTKKFIEIKWAEAEHCRAINARA